MTFAELKILIDFLPQIVSFCKAIIKKVNDGVEAAQIKNALKVFDSALDTAVKTKDTTDLENIFRGKNP